MGIPFQDSDSFQQMRLHKEIFFQYVKSKPKQDCNYTFPIEKCNPNLVLNNQIQNQFFSVCPLRAIHSDIRQSDSDIRQCPQFDA